MENGMSLDLYACATKSHRRLVEQHFVPSIPPSLVLRELREFPQPSVSNNPYVTVDSSGVFDAAGFNEAVVRKVDHIIEVIRDRLALGRLQPFVYSDVDVRFYAADIGERLAADLGEHDIAFQDDGPGALCTGFMVMRACDATLRLFELARDVMIKDKGHDQDAVNKVLRDDGANPVCSWRMLDQVYFSVGQTYDTAEGRWLPGCPIFVPPGIRVHHANWTVGIDNKLALLEAVRERVDQYERVGRAAREMERNRLEAIVHAEMREGADDPQERTYTTSEVRRIVERQRAQFALKHHPMPLAIVLQYWAGDAERAMDLARLMADIEPARRDDVLLVFAEQAGTAKDMGYKYRAVKEAKRYAVEKFNACEIVVPVDAKKKYPGIAFDPWVGALRWLWERYQDGDLPHHSAFFCEWDGCPMTRTWIDDLKRAHQLTLDLGKMVTGARMREPLHVNGTLVMLTRMLADVPSIGACPPRAAWDIHHGHAFVRELGPATPIGNHWGMRSMPETVWTDLAHTYCWLTSTKDGCAQHWARRNLVDAFR